MSIDAIGNFVPRRNVSIRRDGEDFVVVFEARDVVAFRSKDANALRRACRWLRYAITYDHALTDAEEKALAA
jgi:tRNA threonylcarbamoyladenosine modification (KEOPS) complex  Pcc1 subunit